MELDIKIGLSNSSEVVVSEKNSAKTLGSGKLDVFATPAMVALMENAAMNAIAPLLPEGNDSVGIEISTTHSKATPLGATVKATATVTAVDGRKIDFEIVAEDDKGEIGRATHSRFIVDAQRFMDKLKK